MYGARGATAVGKAAGPIKEPREFPALRKGRIDAELAPASDIIVLFGVKICTWSDILERRAFPDQPSFANAQG
jgi:hypothetical protein